MPLRPFHLFSQTVSYPSFPLHGEEARVTGWTKTFNARPFTQHQVYTHDWEMFSLFFVGAGSVSVAEPQNPKGGFGAFNFSSDVTSCS